MQMGYALYSQLAFNEPAEKLKHKFEIVCRLAAGIWRPTK